MKQKKPSYEELEKRIKEQRKLLLVSWILLCLLMVSLIISQYYFYQTIELLVFSIEAGEYCASELNLTYSEFLDNFIRFKMEELLNVS